MVLPGPFRILLAVFQAKDPQAVQPHLKKCFEAIARLDFAADLKISSMESPEGEVMPFDKPMYPEVSPFPLHRQFALAFISSFCCGALELSLIHISEPTRPY